MSLATNAPETVNSAVSRTIGLISSRILQETAVELICEICPGPVIETGLPSVLKGKGWEIGRSEAFCPCHRYEI